MLWLATHAFPFFVINHPQLSSNTFKPYPKSTKIHTNWDKNSNYLFINIKLKEIHLVLDCLWDTYSQENEKKNTN